MTDLQILAWAVALGLAQLVLLGCLQRRWSRLAIRHRPSRRTSASAWGDRIAARTGLQELHRVLPVLRRCGAAGGTRQTRESQLCSSARKFICGLACSMSLRMSLRSLAYAQRAGQRPSWASLLCSSEFDLYEPVPPRLTSLRPTALRSLNGSKPSVTQTLPSCTGPTRASKRPCSVSASGYARGDVCHRIAPRFWQCDKPLQGVS
jgi:hypothetical protein